MKKWLMRRGVGVRVGQWMKEDELRRALRGRLDDPAVRACLEVLEQRADEVSHAQRDPKMSAAARDFAAGAFDALWDAHETIRELAKLEGGR